MYSFNEILNVLTASVEIPAPQSKKDDFSSRFGKEGKFMLSLNETDKKKVEGNKGFYQDKATVDDMGEKKMFEEKSEIGKSEVLGEATVNLEGYLFTEFIPNSVYLLDKEHSGKIWRTKPFEVEIGPMRDQEAKDLSKEKKVTFTLK
ncbi:hypothetical protein KDN24_16970 [Bacillus sp. Bva_UNVM-123]|uniref:hypothetical protein n=1 Tax=Bacillus sp. Bva_UNVM-123 TaxID=2829798 RepID=UPI00391F7C2F